MLSSSNDNFPAVEQNLKMSWGKWGRLTNILGREGVDRRTVESFYVAVVQVVLVFDSETWLMIPRLEKVIEGFHHRVVRQMAVMYPKRQRYGTLVYTPIGAELEIVGLE